MEIEIITTKKKLTKSILSQMEYANLLALKLGTCLGYIINGKKNVYKLLLIRYDEKYSTIPSNFTKGETSVYRKAGKWSSSIKFDSEAECNSWWTFYQTRLKEAITQIYI